MANKGLVDILLNRSPQQILSKTGAPVLPNTVPAYARAQQAAKLQRNARRAEFARTGVLPPTPSRAVRTTPRQERMANLTAGLRRNTGASAPMLAQKLRAREEQRLKMLGMQ